MDDPVNNHEMKRLKALAANPERVSTKYPRITPNNITPPYTRQEEDEFVTAVADAIAEQERDKRRALMAEAGYDTGIPKFETRELQTDRETNWPFFAAGIFLAGVVILTVWVMA